MLCHNCINHLSEKDVAELADDDKIKKQFNAEKGKLNGHLRRGEKPVFCVWNYTVMGSKSVCADVETMEIDDDE